jgi:hypothetical protein
MRAIFASNSLDAMIELLHLAGQLTQRIFEIAHALVEVAMLESCACSRCSRACLSLSDSPNRSATRIDSARSWADAILLSSCAAWARRRRDARSKPGTVCGPPRALRVAGGGASANAAVPRRNAGSPTRSGLAHRARFPSPAHRRHRFHRRRDLAPVFSIEVQYLAENEAPTKRAPVGRPFRK